MTKDPMTNYQTIFENITSDHRYLENLDWGRPRRGHPEGTVRAHIAELEENLSGFDSQIDEPEYWRLRCLIHTHDSFKAQASKGVSITDPRSHASLARQFLATWCNDDDILNMVQFHDEPYALWRKVRHGGFVNVRRRDQLIATIQDWELFLKFLCIDNVTVGKSRDPLRWMAREIASRVGLQAEVVSWVEMLAEGLKIRSPQISQMTQI